MAVEEVNKYLIRDLINNSHFNLGYCGIVLVSNLIDLDDFYFNIKSDHVSCEFIYMGNDGLSIFFGNPKPVVSLNLEKNKFEQEFKMKVNYESN